MKKTFLTLGMSLLAVASLFTGCKESAGVETVIPTVSITADANFASDNTANLTLTLSETTTEEVTVTLGDAEVQSGKTKVTAIYSKTVTIKAGETSAKVTVQAETLGLESGEYQAAIQIVSAEGAEVAETPVVYIGFDYVERPTVELYADETDVPATKAFNLIVRLSAAYTEDVTVTLGDGADSNVPAVYEKNATVPAGETEIQVPVTVNTDELAPGTYKVVVDIVSAEGAVVGTAKSASLNLQYPFVANITIDGLFDDWDKAPILSEYVRPDGNVLYPIGKTLKLAANKNDIYVYFEFEEPADHGYTEFVNNAMNYNFFVDPDGDPNTGCAVGTTGQYISGEPFTPQGFTYYIEGFLRDGSAEPITNFTGTNIYLAEATTDGNYLWGGATLTNLAGSYDGNDIFGVGTYENGLGRVEVKLSRTFFGVTGGAFRFAIRMINSTDFDVMSLMPQNATNAAGEFVPAEMMTVSLPEYEAPVETE